MVPSTSPARTPFESLDHEGVYREKGFIGYKERFFLQHGREHAVTSAGL